MWRRDRAMCAVAALLLACGGGEGGSGGGSDAGAGAEPLRAASLEAHVLSRAGYGPDAWSRQRIAELGVDAYLEEQLDPASIPDDALEARLADSPSLGLELVDLVDRYASASSLPLRELQRARLLRDAFSHRQLEQVLVDFWFDHFNVYGGTGRIHSMSVLPYERDAIRPHVLGRFEDLLRAVARSAAMLYYLDNFVNVMEGFDDRGARRGPNENYARELLELHSVGVDAGFTQQDVIDVARAFSGWTVSLDAAPPDGFYFHAASHDPGAKRVMDLALPPGRGMQDGLDVLAYLAAHPSTAARVCRGLATRLVSESPPARLVEECAGVFRSSGGDLRAVTRALLFSREFRDPARRGEKMKRPQVLVASLLRATGARPDDKRLDWLIEYLILLGEWPYMAHPPTGFPDASSHWTAVGTLLARFDLVASLCAADSQQGIDWGVRGGGAAQIVDALAARLLAGAPGDATRDAAVARVEALGAAPDAERVREAAVLLLSSPEFMRH